MRVLVFCLPRLFFGAAMAQNATFSPTEWFLIRIPKTASISASRDMPQLLAPGAHLAHGETCFRHGARESIHMSRDYPPYDEAGRTTSTVTLLREPRAHVFSQYLECRYDRWGRKVTHGTAFPRSSSVHEDFDAWLQHFANKSAWGEAAAGVAGGCKLQTVALHDNKLRGVDYHAEMDRHCTSADFSCYNPYNMQTRAMACPHGAWQGPHWCYTPHRTCNERPPPLELALRSLSEGRVVGLVEEYNASLCLLHLVAARDGNATVGTPPPLGNTTFQASRVRAVLARASKVTHGVPPHSSASLPPATLALVDQLTTADRQLYAAAVARFHREVAGTPCEDFLHGRGRSDGAHNGAALAAQSMRVRAFAEREKERMLPKALGRARRYPGYT